MVRSSDYYVTFWVCRVGAGMVVNLRADPQHSELYNPSGLFAPWENHGRRCGLISLRLTTKKMVPGEREKRDNFVIIVFVLQSSLAYVFYQGSNATSTSKHTGHQMKWTFMPPFV